MSGMGRLKRPARHTGGALIAAMLTVTVVATLAASALWQHWQQVESEILQRQRQQAAWVLVGALDWSRLVLREDARDNSVDHLAEPWALPLREARLSTFLSADAASADRGDMMDAFLSGQISDMDAKLNFGNLLDGKQISAKDLTDFQRLFRLLNLPQEQLNRAVENYRFSVDSSSENQSAAQAPLSPQRWAQLRGLGLSPATLAQLEPFVTLLPERTKVNLNTAPTEVLMASLDGLDAADAQQLIRLRDQSHFKGLPDVIRAMPSMAWQVSDARHGVSSRFFEIRGQLRMDNRLFAEKSLVVRNGTDVRVLWRSPLPEALSN